MSEHPEGRDAIAARYLKTVQEAQRAGLAVAAARGRLQRAILKALRANAKALRALRGETGVDVERLTVDLVFQSNCWIREASIVASVRGDEPLTAANDIEAILARCKVSTQEQPAL